MKRLDHLLQKNRDWADAKRESQPDFFSRLVSQQSPRYLWIGCADSRVPANEIVDLEPGELFVHRNVANLVIHTDLNCLSVLQYAVDVLQVKHVIVCGHYGCGGVRAAISSQSLGLIDNWLRHIKDIYRLHAKELDAIPNEETRYERLIELNVFEQVHHLAELSFVQLAWQREQRPTLHGWIYDLHTGNLKQVAKVDPGNLPHDIFVYEFSKEQLGES